jgi:hypothetical protein
MTRRNLIGLLLFVALGATRPLSALAELNVPREKLHVYLLAGQSNMAGRGRVAEQDRKIHPRVFVLNRENEWVPAQEPLHFDKPAYVGVGPGLAFGKAMAEADPNAIIGLVPCAVGGSPISTWRHQAYHKQTKSHPYDDALKRGCIAMQKGVLKGILWHQGEGDSNAQNGPLYEQRLTELISNLRRELETPNLLFVAAMPADAFVARVPAAHFVIDAIKAVAAADENVYWVSAQGLDCKADRVHFNADSARLLGRRYAEAVVQRKNITAPEPRPAQEQNAAQANSDNRKER